jgi:hypothetical protein
MVSSKFLSREKYSVYNTCSVIADAAKAILAVKMLGKVPAGSEVIARSANLSTLLALSTSFKNDQQATIEALRCVANALLLIDSARDTWVDKQVGGGDACISLLDVRVLAITISNKLTHWWPLRNRPRPTKFLSHLASFFFAPCLLPLALLYDLLWKTNMDHRGQQWTLSVQSSTHLRTAFYPTPEWVGKP